MPQPDTQQSPSRTILRSQWDTEYFSGGMPEPSNPLLSSGDATLQCSLFPPSHRDTHFFPAELRNKQAITHSK